MYCDQRSQYIRPSSKKNSFRGNYSRKYGIFHFVMVNEGWIIFISYVNAYYKKTSARKILPTCGLGHKKFVWTDLSLCYLKLKTSGVGTNLFSRLLVSKYNSIQSIFSNISSPFIFNHKNSSWVRIGSMAFVIALTIVKFVSDFIEIG